MNVDVLNNVGNTSIFFVYDKITRIPCLNNVFVFDQKQALINKKI